MVYKKRAPARRKAPVKYSRTKKMVTGHGPTLLEQIASGAGSVAKLATAVAPVIAAINTESKYYDETASFSTYGTNSNPDLRCLTDSILQGVTDSTRIGNSILAKDLQLRLASSMTMTTNASPNVLGCHHRVILFVWKYNDSGGPSITKILESPTNIYSNLNKDYTDQFVVLKDKFLTYNATMQAGTVASGIATQDYKSMKVYKKLDYHMRWTDANQAIANHVWMLTMSTPSGLTNAVNTTFYSRLNYTDN